MIRRLLLIFIAFPTVVWSQVPAQKPVFQTDTVKPRLSDSLQVDTSDIWKDTLTAFPTKRILREGEEDNPDRPLPRKRKFKIRFSDRIQYATYLDWPMTSGAGVPTALTFQRKFSAWEDSILPSHLKGDTTWRQLRVSKWYRFGKIMLIDAPLETMFMAIEQDFFGSMARTREISATGYGYKFELPQHLFFGRPIGHISFDREKTEAVYSRQQLAQIHGAALEAGSMATEQLSIRWMQRHSIYYKEAIHFLRLQAAGIASVYSTPKTAGPGKFDVSDWLYYSNSNYGFVGEYGYTAGNMKRDYALAAFTNPLFYASLYSVFNQYLMHGKDSMSTPSIRIGYGKSMLPWIRYGLTPFGAEWIPELTFTKHRQVFNFYGRIGTGTFQYSFGGGVKMYNMVRSSNFLLNLHLAAWNQPYFYKSWADQSVQRIGIGGALILSGYFKLSANNEHPISLALQAGYKTRGYTEGEVWDASPILRVGLSFAIDRDYEQDNSIPEYEIVQPRKLRVEERKKEKKAEKKQAKKLAKKYSNNSKN